MFKRSVDDFALSGKALLPKSVNYPSISV
ncbi:MAG: hypothetical protein ACI9C3_002809, partial [Yoonia sp.]